MDEQTELNIAYKYLFDTDWQVIRLLDNGTPMDPDVKAAREAARQTIKRIKGAE